MKKYLSFLACVLILSLVGAGGVMAQALTLGTVSITGDVKVTGPGGMVYTGAGEKAPLFPGSAVKVGTGQATVDLAGKGSISLAQHSALAFRGDVPYFDSGTFQVRILPGKSMTFHTTQGLVEAKAGNEPAVLSVVVENGKTRVSLLTGNVALKSKSAAVVYKLEGGKYVVQGSEYSFAGKGEALMAARGAVAGGAVGAGAAGAGVAGATVAEVGAATLPIALGLSGVSAVTMVAGAKNTHSHPGPKVASPYTP